MRRNPLFEPLFRFWAIGRLVCVGEPLCAHTHTITHGNVANPLFMGTFVFARAVTEKRIYSSKVVYSCSAAVLVQRPASLVAS